MKATVLATSCAHAISWVTSHLMPACARVRITSRTWPTSGGSRVDVTASNSARAVPALILSGPAHHVHPHAGDPQLAHDDLESHNALQLYLLNGNPQNPT